MLLEPRDSILGYSRRRRRKFWQGPGIIALFLGGIILVVVSFVFSDDEEEIPDLPENRQIERHASSLPDDDFAPSPDESTDNDSDDTVSAKPVGAQKLAGGTKTQIAAPQKPMEASAAAAAAMYDIARKPVAVGATGPQTGRFTIVNSPITYDQNASPEAIAAAESNTYVVVSGDILGRIAQKHGCTIAQLQKANGMPNDQIRIGQKLRIPNCKTGSVEEIQPPADEPEKPKAQRGRWWKSAGVNTTALPQLMEAEGFKPPQKFRAFVIEITFDDTRQVITKERAFDYKGTSASHQGWNPASAVKTFAAIGALQRIDQLGFSSKARVTFNGKKPYTTTVRELIEAAIINSNNIAYNRVVQLASFEKLHKELFTPKYGLTQTALNRAYQSSDWIAMGEDASLRVSPSITLTEGGKTYTIPAANSKVSSICSSGACTSLQDLGEETRRLMLQEQLPPGESFNLKNEDLIMLRRAMRSADRIRGTEMVDRFAAVFNDPRVKFYSKPGFSADWFTDNAYIFDPRTNQAWIVVMTGYPGRSSLNSAATAIAKIISSGKLKNVK